MKCVVPQVTVNDKSFDIADRDQFDFFLSINIHCGQKTKLFPALNPAVGNLELDNKNSLLFNLFERSQKDVFLSQIETSRVVWEISSLFKFFF